MVSEMGWRRTKGNQGQKHADFEYGRASTSSGVPYDKALVKAAIKRVEAKKPEDSGEDEKELPRAETLALLLADATRLIAEVEAWGPTKHRNDQDYPSPIEFTALVAEERLVAHPDPIETGNGD